MSTKKNTESREILILERTKNKKKEFYFLVQEYMGSSSLKKKQFNYPQFRKTFETRKAAKDYAIETAKKMEARFTNIRFITRLL
jgi:hypothetical protein